VWVIAAKAMVMGMDGRPRPLFFLCFFPVMFHGFFNGRKGWGSSSVAFNVVMIGSTSKIVRSVCFVLNSGMFVDS
jgi:hypothetical protein